MAISRQATGSRPAVLHALTQLSPNLEKHAAEAEWTAQVLSTGNAQLMECASHGSFQLALPLSLPAHSSQGQLTAPASPAESSPELTTEQVTHLHWQCQKANRSLSSVCAVPTSPSTSLCRPQLKYILKTHSKAKHLKCKPSLHHMDLVPFPQRFSHLSLSIHPQTWTCHEYTIGGFQLPLFTSLAPSRPTELQDTFRLL